MDDFETRWRQAQQDPEHFFPSVVDDIANTARGVATKLLTRRDELIDDAVAHTTFKVYERLARIHISTIRNYIATICSNRAKTLLRKERRWHQLIDDVGRDFNVESASPDESPSDQFAKAEQMVTTIALGNLASALRQL